MVLLHRVSFFSLHSLSCNLKVNYVITLLPLHSYGVMTNTFKSVLSISKIVDFRYEVGVRIPEISTCLLYVISAKSARANSLYVSLYYLVFLFDSSEYTFITSVTCIGVGIWVEILNVIEFVPFFFLSFLIFAVFKHRDLFFFSRT